jgi:hypothetical protein
LQRRDSTAAQSADEPERSDGNPKRSEQSHFFATQKKFMQKEKILTGK